MFLIFWCMYMYNGILKLHCCDFTLLCLWRLILMSPTNFIAVAMKSTGCDMWKSKITFSCTNLNINQKRKNKNKTQLMPHIRGYQQNYGILVVAHKGKQSLLILYVSLILLKSVIKVAPLKQTGKFLKFKTFLQYFGDARVFHPVSAK